MAAPEFPRRPIADKFLYRALVRVNAYKYAKFQVPNSINVKKTSSLKQCVRAIGLVVIIHLKLQKSV